MCCAGWSARAAFGFYEVVPKQKPWKKDSQNPEEAAEERCALRILRL